MVSAGAYTAFHDEPHNCLKIAYHAGAKTGAEKGSISIHLYFHTAISQVGQAFAYCPVTGGQALRYAKIMSSTSDGIADLGQREWNSWMAPFIPGIWRPSL